jgi:hypothetical protein
LFEVREFRMTNLGRLIPIEINQLGYLLDSGNPKM